MIVFLIDVDHGLGRFVIHDRLFYDEVRNPLSVGVARIRLFEFVVGVVLG